VLFRVLATGDLHGAFLPDGGFPGVGALAAALDSLGDDCGCAQLRLAAGDALQGTPLQDETRGRPGMLLLARLGYAAAALGDHDFDWSLDVVRRGSRSRRIRGSRPIWWTAPGRRPEWIVPYRMLDVAGLPVAVIGYITADTKHLLPAARTRGLRFGEGELALHGVLGEVGARRPAITILLAHAGGACDSVVCTGEIVRLAEQLGGRGVSLIVAGHTHRLMTTRVAGIPILETGSGGRMVGVADLVKTPAGGLDFRIGVAPVDSARVGGDAGFRAALETYRRRDDSLVTRPLAEMKRPLVRAGAQYPLGALLAEARRNALRTDLASSVTRRSVRISGRADRPAAGGGAAGATVRSRSPARS
jgi:5'-nucleotidase